jgi:carboxyl-terminal processing protease
MVNAYSASASEIVAGALQDWDRALIVGQTTFGKGSVQSVFPISRNTALKLTTQKYYTPSGRCIHKERNKDGEVVNEIASGEVREKFFTNNERVVYGGGGITPDWELELTEMTDLQQKLALKGIFFSFAVHYAAYHDISENFEVNEKVLEEFRKYAAEKDIEINEENWTAENIDYVRTGIRREIFRKLKGTEGAYLATLPEDEEFQKVMKLFRETNSLSEMFEQVERMEEEAKEGEEGEEEK